LGDYKVAIPEFEKALRGKPDIASANLFIGIDYLKLGLSARAIVHLQAALRAQPSNREALHALATCYLDQERYRDAVEQFRILWSLEPDKAEALYRFAATYLDLAKHLAGRMSQRYQNTSWANRLAGDLLAEALRWTDAVLLYRQAVRLAPDEPAIHSSLGQVYLHQGSLQKAEQEFQSALKLDPRNEGALLGMTEVDLASGLTGPAFDCVERIWATFPPFLAQPAGFPSIKFSSEKAEQLAARVEELPESPARRFLLAELYYANGAEERARIQSAGFEHDLAMWREKQDLSNEPATNPCAAHRYTDCARSLEPDRQRSHARNLMLGEALFALAEDVRAADAFAEAVAQNRESPEAIYWLARTYKRLADHAFAELVDKFPSSVRVYEFRAESDQLREAYDDAINDFQAAIRLRPDDSELHEKLSQVYLEKKMFPEADRELETAMELSPGRARTLYLMGRSRLSQHREREGLPFLQEAVRMDPSLLEARAALGQAYMRLKQPARALPELEKAAVIDFHGDIHYLMYIAYRDVGKTEAAQKALARSQELRNNLAAKQQARIVDEVESEQQ
jgi:tetratricopeptide (TPR) repeat protein